MAGPGGKREGAGRKKGIPNKRTQAAQKKVESTGATPLDVMIAEMRFHHGLAEAEAKKRKPDLVKIASHREAASAAAQRAAPYVHAKLQAVTWSGDPEKPLEHKVTVEFVEAAKA